MTKNTEIIPQQKLKVFISSICGQPKYDSIRAELKELIEHTDFAKVYTFESEGASTISAGSHYVFALEDCDVCIFLIDNKDGITEGVQREIDTVKKHGIKALYYFCTENSDEETSLQKNLKGATYAKSKNVKSFNELSTRGAQDLIDDIVFVYHHYCQGRLEFVPDNDNDSTLIHVSGFIAELFEYKKNYKLSPLEESVLLFNASDWLHSSNADVRWNSIRILFSLSRTLEHREIINRIIIDIIDSENVYIKNLILTQMPKDDRVNEETRKYVYGVCENDANYVVRMRCKEIMQGEKNE